MREEKASLNFISVAGFIISALSVPLFFLCIGQGLGLILSIIGLNDARKCGDRGRGFSIAGIVLSTLVIIITPIVFIYAIQYGLRYSDIDFNTLMEIIEFFL